MTTLDVYGRARRGLIIGAAVMLALAGLHGPSRAEEPIKLGSILSLSGPVAALGKFTRSGIDLAMEEINADGGINGRPLELVTYNDESSPDNTVSLAMRLIDQEQVVAILGASFASTINALGAIAERQQVPVVSPTAVTLPDQRKWDYTFFTMANFDDAVNGMLAYASEQGYQRMGLIRLSREYGQIGSELLHKYAPDHGIEIVAEEQGADGDRDFTSQLTKIRAAEPDFMVVWFAVDAGATIAKNMTQLGMEQPVIGPISLANPALIEAGGSDVEGWVISSQIAGGDPLPRQEEFVERFMSVHGYEPNTYEALGYDLVKITAKALRNIDGPYTREKLRDAIEQVEYDGAGTKIRFSAGDHEPDPESLVLVKIQDGGFVLVD